MFTATQEQIKDWKNKYGSVFRIKVADAACYLRTPDRKILGFASVAGKSDPLKFPEAILRNCWLAGDEVIRENDAYFLGAAGQLDQIVEIKEAELEKL